MGLAEGYLLACVLLHHDGDGAGEQAEVAWRHAFLVAHDALNDGGGQRLAQQFLLHRVAQKLLFTVVACAYVHAHEHVALRSLHTVQRQGVYQRPVYQEHVLLSHRIEKQGDGYAGPYGFIQTARSEHNLAAAVPVGGHGGIGYGQVLDVHVGHNLLQGVDHLHAFHQVVQAEGEIDQREDLLPVEAHHPPLHLAELACGIHASDQGAHGAARYGGDGVVGALQLLNGADMGQAAGATARQHQRYVLLLHVLCFFRYVRAQARLLTTSSMTRS